MLWTPRVELTHRAISARQHIVLYAHLSFCFTFFKGDENVQNYIVLITFQEFNFLQVIDSHPSLRAKLRSLPHKMAELWDVSFMLYFLLFALVLFKDHIQSMEEGGEWGESLSKCDAKKKTLQTENTNITKKNKTKENGAEVKEEKKEGKLT